MDVFFPILISYVKDIMNSHLLYANQTYWEHLKDSMSFSYRSFKASFCFFIHGLVPNLYETAGSEQIHKLEKTIQLKYENMSNVEVFGEFLV
jgi:hypothetical protein